MRVATAEMNVAHLQAYAVGVLNVLEALNQLDEEGCPR